MNFEHVDLKPEQDSGSLKSTLAFAVASKRRPGPKERAELARREKKLIVVTSGTRRVPRAPRLDELDEDPQD